MDICSAGGFYGNVFMDAPGINWWMLVLSLPVLLYSGRTFYVNAWKQAKQFTSNMDTLVALSTSIAFCLVYSIQFILSSGLNEDWSLTYIMKQQR